MAKRLSREEWMQAQRENEPDFDRWLVEAARVVVPCDCGDDDYCRGWVVRSAGPLRLSGGDAR